MRKDQSLVEERINSYLRQVHLMHQEDKLRQDTTQKLSSLTKRAAHTHTKRKNMTPQFDSLYSKKGKLKRCLKCLGFGHYYEDCPNKRVTTLEEWEAIDQIEGEDEIISILPQDEHRKKKLKKCFRCRGWDHNQSVCPTKTIVTPLEKQQATCPPIEMVKTSSQLSPAEELGSVGCEEGILITESLDFIEKSDVGCLEEAEQGPLNKIEQLQSVYLVEPEGLYSPITLPEVTHMSPLLVHDTQTVQNRMQEQPLVEYLPISYASIVIPDNPLPKRNSNFDRKESFQNLMPENVLHRLSSSDLECFKQNKLTLFKGTTRRYKCGWTNSKSFYRIGNGTAILYVEVHKQQAHGDVTKSIGNWIKGRIRRGKFSHKDTTNLRREMLLVVFGIGLLILYVEDDELKDAKRYLDLWRPKCKMKRLATY